MIVQGDVVHSWYLERMTYVDAIFEQYSQWITITVTQL